MRRRNFLATVAGAGVAGLGVSTSNAGAPPAPTGDLKKGVSIWCFPGGTPVREAMRKAKETGFHGIELAYAEKGEIGPNSTADQMRSLVEESHKVGIEIAGLATGELWTYPLSSNDASEREHGKTIIAKMLELAEGLSVDSILVVPGNCKVRSGPPGRMAVRYETAWQRSSEIIRSLVPEAEKRKVAISIEDVWNNFLLSPLEMRSYIDQFNSQYVRAHLDIGNIIRYGYAQDWILTLGPRIKRVHVKDFNINKDAFVNLLEGDLDWPAAIAAFREVGFKGHLIAELSAHRAAPDLLLWNTSKALDYILAM